MKNVLTTRKAGLRVGPAWLVGPILLLSIAGGVSAQRTESPQSSVSAPATITVEHGSDAKEAAVSKAGSEQVLPISSLVGIGIGTPLDEARSKLSKLGTGGGRETRDGGSKEAWTLRETDFATVAFKSNGAGKVVWISAFVRAGREVPFSTLGDPGKATSVTSSQIVWNVATPGGGYRLVAKGSGQKASVIYLLSLDFPEIK